MTKNFRLSSLFALGLCFALSGGPQARAEPSDEGGRYALSPVEGGVLKLDKTTGEVSMCAKSGTSWSCEPVEDRSKSTSNGKDLSLENKELKDRIKALEEALENIASPPPAKGDGTESEGPPVPKAQLPTEEEVDQALDYVERIFKKFRDRIRRLDEPLPPGQPSEQSKPAEPPKTL